MSQREDGKLRQVPVATYNYRHEAEFAAGFLEDAGIPYRLQIEDPTLGLSASNAATLWVTAFDEREARRVLDQEMALEPGDDDESWRVLEDVEQKEAGKRGGSAASDPAGSSRSRPPPPRAGSGRVASRKQPDTDLSNHKPDLTLRQRLIALGGSVATASLLGIDAVREAHFSLALGLALVAVGLAVVGMYGKAPDFLARILDGLSGDAP